MCKKIAQLVLEARAFYDVEMIAQIINSILRSSSHHQHAMSNNKKPTIGTVAAASEVSYLCYEAIKNCRDSYPLDF
jgi:hypothetical protein